MACLVFTYLFTLNHCSLMFFYSFYRWHLGDVIISSRGFNDLNTNKAHYIWTFFKTASLVSTLVDNTKPPTFQVPYNSNRYLTVLPKLQVINLLKFYR